jgi:ferredoxin
VTSESGGRLRVDPIACDGRGLCAEALPELITLDDWGFPVTSGRPVPAWLLADARETVRACLKLALRLERLRSPRSARRRGSPPMSGL